MLDGGDGGGVGDPREGLRNAIPRLRAAARELVGDPVVADRLVMETLTEALAGWDDAESGAALETWLLLILGGRVVARDRADRTPR